MQTIRLKWLRNPEQVARRELSWIELVCEGMQQKKIMEC